MTPEQRFRVIIDHAPIVFTTFDKDGIVTMYDGRGLEALGRKPGEIVGLSVFHLYKDVPEALRYMKEVLGGHEVHHIGLVRHAWLETWMYPTKDEQNNVTGAVAVAVDVTRLKETQLDLMARNAELESVVKTLVGSEKRIAELKEEIRRLKGE